MFTYGITVTDNENLQTSCTFNNLHLKITEETKDNGSILLNRVDLEYDTNKQPVKVVRKDYSSTTGQYMTRVENFLYDTGDFGDLTGYWDTHAQRDLNDFPVNDEHKTTFVYDPSFHYLIEKTYKQDELTTIKEEYIPYTDDRKIEWFKVKVNDVIKNQIRYDYDAYGNIIEEMTYREDLISYISRNYSYSDNDPVRNGQFDGVYLTRKWTEGIRDADNDLVTAGSGNSPGVIDEVLKYDFMGNLIEKTDGNGNVTSYEYDGSGRLVKEIFADSNYREYTYNDLLNSIVVKNENSAEMKYDHDGFGNLLLEVDMAYEEVIKEYYYDQKFRLIGEKSKSKSEYNNESTICYSYTKDGRLSEKQVKNSSGTVEYHESYSYDDAFDNGQYVKTTKTVAGDNDSPAIITNTYKDKHGLIVKSGRMNGAEELSETRSEEHTF